MKKIITAAIAFMMIANFTAMAQPHNPVIAHRGAWKHRNLPENSIASLEAAIQLGCGGSEFDVRMSADDSLVINHDPAFHEMPIEQTDYAALLSFTLSNGEKLPTLREYLLAGTKNLHPTKLIIEIKPSEISKERGKKIAQKVLSLVHELNIQQRVVYISFDYDILLEILKSDKRAVAQYLEGDRDPMQLKKDGVSGCDFHISVYKEHPEWIKTAKEQHLLLNVWTVNEEIDLRWALKQGFDQITTNEPGLAFSMLQGEGDNPNN
jgi:glycerophosphoryl diester phosphodiesterase